MRLENDRMVLRNFEDKDLKDFHDYCSHEGIGEMVGWKQYSNILESKEALDRNIVLHFNFKVTQTLICNSF